MNAQPLERESLNHKEREHHEQEGIVWADVYGIGFLQETAVAKIHNASEEQDAEHIAEHGDPQVEVALVDLNAEVVVDEHHGSCEGEHQESKVDEKVSYRRSALSPTNLALKESVLDQVV
jgi:hypothetical protein